MATTHLNNLQLRKLLDYCTSRDNKTRYFTIRHVVEREHVNEGNLRHWKTNYHYQSPASERATREYCNFFFERKPLPVDFLAHDGNTPPPPPVATTTTTSSSSSSFYNIAKIPKRIIIAEAAATPIIFVTTTTTGVTSSTMTKENNSKYSTPRGSLDEKNMGNNGSSTLGNGEKIIFLEENDTSDSKEDDYKSKDTDTDSGSDSESLNHSTEYFDNNDDGNEEEKNDGDALETTASTTPKESSKIQKKAQKSTFVRHSQLSSTTKVQPLSQHSVLSHHSKSFLTSIGGGTHGGIGNVNNNNKSNIIVRLLSWNCRNLGVSTPLDRKQRIAASFNTFDLVALQELREDNFMQLFRDANVSGRLLEKFAFLQSKSVGVVAVRNPSSSSFSSSSSAVTTIATSGGSGGGNENCNRNGTFTFEQKTQRLRRHAPRRERFGFMYNPTKLKLVSEPHLFDDMEVKYAPYAATFEVVGTGSPATRLTLLSVHVSFGERNNLDKRREEVYKIISLIARLRTRSHRGMYGEIVLCGDFNLPPSDACFHELRRKLHYREVNTTCPTNVSSERKIYDNFFVHNGKTAACMESFGVIQFEGILQMNNRESRAYFTKSISDHLPITMDFHFPFIIYPPTSSSSSS